MTEFFFTDTVLDSVFAKETERNIEVRRFESTGKDYLPAFALNDALDRGEMSKPAETNSSKFRGNICIL